MKWHHTSPSLDCCQTAWLPRHCIPGTVGLACVVRSSANKVGTVLPLNAPMLWFAQPTGDDFSRVALQAVTVRWSANRWQRPSPPWSRARPSCQRRAPWAKALVLMSACCRSETCCPEEDLHGAWQIQGRQQPCEAHSQPCAHGLELTPDLAAVEAITEQLIFQSGNQEQVQVKTALCATNASLCYRRDLRHTMNKSPVKLKPCLV